MKKPPTSFFWKCWKLITNNGRQFWEYKLTPESKKFIKDNQLSETEWLNQLSEAFSYSDKNPNSGDRVFRYAANQKTRLKKTTNKNILKKNILYQHLQAGWDYFFSLQDKKSGHFPGDYGGPLFLIPGFILLDFLTDFKFSNSQKSLIIRYLLNHQNSDGGWGLHIESESTMFTTVLNYVSLRLWGVGGKNSENKNSNALVRAKKWIRNNGGATLIPTWGKYTLSILGLYEWSGNNTLLPESWLLPRWVPFCPENFWCHSRMVYLPLSFLYSIKFKPSETIVSSRLYKEIKSEIYLEDYNKIKWEKHRNSCYEKDLFFPLSPIYKFISLFTNFYEKFHSKKLRNLVKQKIITLVYSEDKATNYINIGPISKVYNTLISFYLKEKYPENKKFLNSFNQHCDRIKDYLWLAEDGLKVSGYNGSQFWDTTFTYRAFINNQDDPFLFNKYKKNLKLIGNYLLNQQVPNGGWPFSTKEHSWPISDCSSEGIYSFCHLMETGLINPNKDQLKHLNKTVDYVLSIQNSDGGFSTYEKKNAPRWMEFINSSMIFGDIVVDYSHIECSSAAIQGLEVYLKSNFKYKNKEIKTAIKRAKNYLIKKQFKDGSWYGFWAICFTYATFFAVKVLNDNNKTHLKAKTKAAKFLLEKQNKDGSWGESYLSSVKKIYKTIEGQITNTSWAVLSLMEIDFTKYFPFIEKGIFFILKNQLNNGDWVQQHISGVFNHNCMITYSNYRNIFPLWALSEYYKKIK